MLLLLSTAFAAELHLADLDALRAAVAAAAPGDILVLDAGDYTLDSALVLDAAGTAQAPITLRGEGATLRSNTVEAIKVRGPYWHIEDLTLSGVCPEDSDCEHALHIVGAADGTRVSGCTLVDFNAQIKGNGEEVDGVLVWPDDVVIEGNDLHDTRARQTANPVTKIDVVGGQRWRVEANRVADFEKGGGDTVSYAAFFKGNSKDGVFERNLVVCSEAYAGGVRLGLSLGGGGTSPDSICEDGTCTPEHQRGVLRNNIIAHCSDVGIYLNEGEDSQILHNTLYDTAGIDVRYPASSATLDGNVLDGVIRERDGGVATLGLNWESFDFAGVFADPEGLDFSLLVDPGLIDAGSAALAEDFCGAPRDGSPDGGALEYTRFTPCDTSRAHPTADSPTADSADTGQPSADKDCGCASASPRAGALGWLLLALVRRR